MLDSQSVSRSSSTAFAAGTGAGLETNQGNFAKLKVVGYRDSNDFSFPEAKLLSEDRRERFKKKPTKDYHLEVEWVLYKK